MKSTEEILSILRDSFTSLCERYPINSLAVFGSYARGDNNISSDLDLLVDFNGRIGILFIDLANELEELTGLKVDIVTRNGIKRNYLEAISKDLLYV